MEETDPLPGVVQADKRGCPRRSMVDERHPVSSVEAKMEEQSDGSHSSQPYTVATNSHVTGLLDLSDFEFLWTASHTAQIFLQQSSFGTRVEASV
jgi:hypothetical protein